MITLSTISSFALPQKLRSILYYIYNSAPYSGTARGTASGGEPTLECGVGVRGGVQECGVQATPYHHLVEGGQTSRGTLKSSGEQRVLQNVVAKLLHETVIEITRHHVRFRCISHELEWFLISISALDDILLES